MIGELNWLFNGLGVVFNMILGTLWYGPFFGKIWLNLMGKTREEIQGGAAWMYLVPLAGSFFSLFMLNLVVDGWGLTLWWQGALFGGVLWLAMGGVALMTTSFYESTKPGLWLLFSAYQVIVHAVLGAVFTL